MKFLIRDDDTCAMTRPEELEACYGDVWDTIPVGLSITPFRVPGTSLGVPEHLLGSQAPLALGDAPDLVSFLREGIQRRRIHVALHGFHHTRPSDQPEYVAGSDLGRKTACGRRYLEEVLGCPVTTFVPPNNRLGAAGFAAVTAAGLNLVNNQPYPTDGGGAPSARRIVDALIAAQYGLRSRLGRPRRFAIRSFLGFKQAPFHTLGPGTVLDELLASLRECRRCSGVFILATHYHAFEQRMKSGERVRQGLDRVIAEIAADPGMEFPTYAEIW